MSPVGVVGKTLLNTTNMMLLIITTNTNKYHFEKLLTTNIGRRKKQDKVDPLCQSKDLNWKFGLVKKNLRCHYIQCTCELPLYSSIINTKYIYIYLTTSCKMTKIALKTTFLSIWCPHFNKENEFHDFGHQ